MYGAYLAVVHLEGGVVLHAVHHAVHGGARVGHQRGHHHGVQQALGLMQGRRGSEAIKIASKRFGGGRWVPAPTRA